MNPAFLILVYGPAYLDRVLRVDRPLLDPRHGRVVDGSVQCLQTEPSAGREDGLAVAYDRGTLRIDPLPPDWPGPSGAIFTDGHDGPEAAREERFVRGVSWLDDLGGMGAGFAKALGGHLVSALGPADDPMSARVSALLEREGIAHRPIRVPDRPADWTLLVTSGGHGDKLAIGFRGCHAAVRTLGDRSEAQSAELVAVAGLPNRLVAEALNRHPSAIRFVAPAMRNMIDRDPPLSTLASSIDILSCNRREWEALPDRDSLASRLSVLAITDGPNGSMVRFHAAGGHTEIAVPAFPRDGPPRDTNRAGEAYASTLVSAILETGWRPPEWLPADLVLRAAERASAAAALVLDSEEFGFPASSEVVAALKAGIVRRQR